MSEKIEKAERIVGRFFLIILLAIFLLGFVIIFSISQNIKEENINKLASDIILEELNKQFSIQVQLGPEEIISSAIGKDGEVDYMEAHSILLEECEIVSEINFEELEYRMPCDELAAIQPEDFQNFVQNEFNAIVQEEIIKQIIEVGFEDIRQRILLECEGKTSIYLENLDYTLDCEELRNLKEGELEVFLEREINSKLGREIDRQLEKYGIARFLPVIGIGVWLFALLIGIMMFLLFLISFHKYKFVFDVGISFMIAGLPFLVLINLKLKLQDNPALNSIVNIVFKSLFKNLLIVFIIGVLVLAIGIVLKISRKKKASSNIKFNNIE